MDCSILGLPSITNSRSLLKLMSIELVMPSNHLILSFPSPPTCSLSQHQGLFKWVSSSYQSFLQWSKYWSFSFSISPSNEYSELISLRIDWFDLLAVQGTLKSLLQHHSLKASILWHSTFFMVQLSHHTWLLDKPLLWLYGTLSEMWCLYFLIRCLGCHSFPSKE